MKVFILLGFLLELTAVYSLPCVSRKFSAGTVCVCNATYCDTLEDVQPSGTSEFIAVTSSSAGERFSVSKGEFADSVKSARNAPSVVSRQQRSLISWLFGAKDVEIKVDRSTTYQNIIGFGGAFTGAVSYNLDKLSPAVQDQVYKSYYAQDTGIGYNMMRIPIGGCDFDLAPWAYNENPKNDPTLSNFTSLDPRDLKIIQQIQQLKAASNMDDIKYYGTAWSPPPWMKTNDAWTGFSSLKTEYYQTWADYHIKWLELMNSHGLPFWGVSTGNEPLNGVISFPFVKFMSLGWTPEDQARWVALHLGPALKNSPVTKGIKLMGPEDQRITLPNWLETMEKTVKGSTDYLDGISMHWYMDSLIPVNRLDESHYDFKNKFMINTESCDGSAPLEKHAPILGSWDRAEKYINDYMSDFSNWNQGWIDWNLLLDEQGGPNYVKNFVDAPIIINSSTGSEIYKQPIFYAIGHFSRFMPPNSVRVEATSSQSSVKTVAFQRPDGSIAVILYNSNSHEVKMGLNDSKRGNIEVTVPAKSIQTYVYN